INFAKKLDFFMELTEKQIAILDAAESLFASKGFEGASVRDIAKKANVNVAMISYYFGSKEKMLQQLLLNRTENSRKLLTQLKQDTHKNSWEKIDRIIDFFVDHLLESRQFHNITSRQISLVQDEDTIELLINIKKTNHAIIEDIIKEGQEKKTFREVNIPLTIGSVFGTISQVSMSQEYYKKVLKEKNEEAYFRKLRPKLKRHLKTLIRNHLALKG